MRQMDFSDAFAAVVKRRREAKGLSKVGLAESAGLHQTYVGLLERGERSPSIDTAHALARALGLPFSKLIVEAERLAEREKIKPARSPRST
jgi:transcriptional regulator with XRE-family HTH domain